jgi:hypothetical protein
MNWIPGVQFPSIRIVKYLLMNWIPGVQFPSRLTRLLSFQPRILLMVGHGAEQTSVLKLRVSEISRPSLIRIHGVVLRHSGNFIALPRHSSNG